ncbi:mechanosensitive ion channel domain-containing protein [Miltoncostaea marina]|uniref:mechanosensitive ion channel domain-containing protein n=1 Tax=Miltoncostaea marina TaxID=2843215 RepID=UPI001C3DF727|nr:mechanosensitive ion channel domain-containing protein [Miltoncostaea marina]
MHLHPLAIFGLPEWAGRLTLVGAVIAGALLMLSAIGWLAPRLLRRTGADAGPRARQRQTAVAALATSLRYVVLVAAAVAIAAVVAGGGGLAAVGSGALVVVLVGFAAQRLLVDVIAGFFILFESQYGVGDTVRLEPSGYTGEVVTVGFRTTELTAPGGQRMIVPNGAITAARVMPDGRRRHRLELLTHDPDAVEGMLAELGGGMAGAGGPWRAAPRTTRRDAPGGVTRIVAVVDVDAHREVAVAWLADALAARAGDRLAAPPLHGPDGRP